MPIQIKLLLAAIVIIGSFSTGWSVKGAFVAKEQLAITEAKNEFINTIRSMEGSIAGVVENKLADLKANERVINNEIVKIVNRDVYRNVCLDADGLQVIERARTGKSNTTKPAE